ncbi:MAG: MBL fold metallo-hydrolase [Acidaminobacteraceae bacterium]
MTEISILLAVVVFSLLLIRHGRVHRKMSIVLFGILLLIALPLSMYKENGSLLESDELSNAYTNTIKIFNAKESNEDIYNESYAKNEEYSFDETDLKVASNLGSKITKFAKDITKINTNVSKDTMSVSKKTQTLKSTTNIVKEVTDFFEFIRGSNVAAVDLNVEDEVVVVGSNYLNDLSKKLEIHVIDVGQGDSLLIKKGALEILIDAGPNEEGIKVVEYLKGNFVKEIDLVISTHPHEDHIGGMDIVLDNIPVKRIIDSGDTLDTKTYRDYMNAVKRSGAELIFDNNIVYDYGDVKVQIIELGDNYKNTNENSVVSVISYNGKNILAAGDLEEDLEDELTQILRAKNINIDVYKASHHGSKTSNSKELLDYMKPEVILISAGEGNKYKHPNRDAMEVFLANTSRVYSTHKSGNLKFTVGDEIVESKDYYNLLITDSNDYR